LADGQRAGGAAKTRIAVDRVAGRRAEDHRRGAREAASGMSAVAKQNLPGGAAAGIAQRQRAVESQAVINRRRSRLCGGVDDSVDGDTVELAAGISERDSRAPGLAERAPPESFRRPA
jgi:hypothetical protein